MSLTDSSDGSLDAPLQGLNSNNHGPWLIVCAYIFIVLSLMTIFIKLFTRFKATNRLTPNDYFILIAGFLAVAQTITITISVHFGMGQRRKNLSDSKFESFEQTYYAANILGIAILAATKASVTLLIVAINPTRQLLLSCYAILGFVGLWTVASILALAFQCNLPSPWDFEGNKCVDLFALNAGIHTLNILSDLLIVLVPFLMMRKVQVSFSKRFIVTGLFSSRLAVPGFTVAMLVYLKRLYKSDDVDPTWEALVPAVFAQIMLNVSIIAACIPSLKPFLADIKPGLIVVNVPEHELTNSFVRQSRSKSGSQTRIRTHKSGAGISRLASRLGLNSNAGKTLNSSSDNSGLWGEKQKQAVTNMELGYNRPHATKASSKVEMDRSESVKGLTDDVILHTIDYKVEYEDPDVITDQSSESPRRERM
ncbi:uncharacterized protein Z518_11370 [Rhinocladiella mackenziei CBS 650.93]|uniref:Rhinocladiella mackenziei CBS 650.93 unplaced genomic scaffold supercont1.13, whole genome shotgun sequence n=1 Tax=Rhinocladiella mackenziei CBS 650.93 TaxID=1442369 RepID=A0A0D2GLX0_9EURO|nr:uncharacterized protein Z518_11370 [Rhinocladiella mackenziei CBS 650.93]KIW99382.1 hypothetical protein Z518_11370 [Rhinocladiella mackenziei CBS 650.93]